MAVCLHVHRAQMCNVVVVAQGLAGLYVVSLVHN